MGWGGHLGMLSQYYYMGLIYMSEDSGFLQNLNNIVLDVLQLTLIFSTLKHKLGFLFLQIRSLIFHCHPQ